MKKTILILIICITSTSALAQSAKKKTERFQNDTQTSQQRLWDAEPESILSIKLGAPLSESMAECPKGKYGYEHRGETMCWTKNQNLPWYEIENYPTPGMYIGDVWGWVVDGAVEQVSFKFAQYDYLKMGELLKSKYGPPSQEKVATVQNRMGATFDSLEMTWVGRNLTLTFLSRAGKIDEGVVRISSKKYFKSEKFNADQFKDKL